MLLVREVVKVAARVRLRFLSAMRSHREAREAREAREVREAAERVLLTWEAPVARAKRIVPQLTWLIPLLLLPVLVRPLHGQQTDLGTTQRRMLDVRRQQIELRVGRAEFSRVEQLQREGLVPVSDLEEARATLEKLQLAYQEAVLALLSVKPRVVVEKAVKYRDGSGRRFVRLSIANRTPALDDSRFDFLNNFEGAEPIPEELRVQSIQDLFISLQDPGNSGGPSGNTIALPYQQYVQELEYGSQKTLVFKLLRDVSSVIVSIGYLGEEQDLQIQLEQAESGKVLDISSTQLSQEADLGSPVVYALRLERSSVDSRSFYLQVVGLPRQVSYRFVEPRTQARVSQLNFPAGVTEQDIELRLFLPEQAGEGVVIDQPIEFWTVARDEPSSVVPSPKGEVDVESLESSGAGYLRLSLTPQGLGEIDLSTVSLFSEIEVGGRAIFPLTLKNVGTRRLDGVSLKPEAPPGWRVVAEPSEVTSLGLNRETTAELVVEPPSDVAVGDYEIRLRADTFVDGRKLPTQSKIFRVSVKPRSNPLLVTLLVSLLALVLLGAILFVVRITRR